MPNPAPDSPTWYPGAHRGDKETKPAVVMADTGEVLTYGELDDAANRIARVFGSRGLAPGDHVAICAENRVDYLEVMWGAHYAGLYYTLISTHLAPDEVVHIVRDCEAGAVVLSATTAGVYLDAVRAAVPGVAVLTLDATPYDGAEELSVLMSGRPAEPLPGAVEGSEMLYSSGTTGRPKGIRPTSVGAPLGTTPPIPAPALAMFQVDEDTVYLSPAPLYHAAPARWTRSVTAVGGTVVLLRKFDAALALEAIAKHHVTHSQWVPTMFTRLLRLPEEVRRGYDPSSHRFAIHAAAPCPPQVKQAMIDWWGPVLVEYYAGSEGHGMTVCTTPEWLEHPGTVGRAVVGRVHIVGADGEELGPGQEGVVYFSGGPPFEYYKDPDKTRSAQLPGGLATMGDIGRLDEDGYLHLTDRLSNTIISGGVNIYPQEIESLLASHPDVEDVAVIGVPDEEFGEQVKAVVQRVPGPDSDEAVAARLIAYCRDHAAHVKCPRSVDFRVELPRHPNGKLLKRLLKDEYWAGQASRLV